eukprot:TRINITY_DN8657_c0_g1_i4.p2 TRINITY_DN8657_c0_g1~~TRINITY_DN8657_c0_g1_i4.p2  ORF type:complete len:263 (+),score=113.28 TRINITY_DN8657_c0_g1_i4:167-955(+)
MNTEIMQKYQQNAENTRAPADELLKDFFVEERVYPMTVESLLDRIRMKNHKFKNLFKLYEKLLAMNDLLMASKGSTATPKKFSSARKDNSDESKDYVIKELLSEMQGLKEMVASKRPLQSAYDESLWKEKVKILEEKLQLASQKLKEAENELERKMGTIAEKDKEIGRLNINNERLQAELNQGRGSMQSPSYVYERRYEASPPRHQARPDSFESKFKEAAVKLNEKTLENQDLKSINAQLQRRLESYKEQHVSGVSPRVRPA